jgi:hypothetical protein
MCGIPRLAYRTSSKQPIPFGGETTIDQPGRNFLLRLEIAQPNPENVLIR